MIIAIGGDGDAKGFSGGESSTITDDVADFTLRADGDLEVVEKLTLELHPHRLTNASRCMDQLPQPSKTYASEKPVRTNPRDGDLKRSS